MIRGRVGAVQVLRLGIAERAGSEAEHLAALVADREDEAIPKTVAGPAAPSGGMHETGVDQLLDAGAPLAGQIPRQRVLAGAARGGETDAEAPGQRLVDASVAEQGTAGLACGCRPQHVLVVGLRLGVELDRAAATPAGAAARVGAAFELHPGAVGEHVERLPEVDALDLLDEREEIAAVVTAVAVPDLAFAG